MEELVKDVNKMLIAGGFECRAQAVSDGLVIEASDQEIDRVQKEILTQLPDWDYTTKN